MELDQLLFFDNVYMLPDKIQRKISNHFVDGRHHFVSSFYLSQSYFDTPKIIRTNCKNLILFKQLVKMILVKFQETTILIKVFL